MARKITPKQKKFADTYLKTGNGSLSAKEAYNVSTDESARAIATENLQKPVVVSYLEGKAARAAEIVYEIAENGESDSVRLNASKDILDRAGFGAVDKNLNLNANINTQELQESILKQLQQFRGK